MPFLLISFFFFFFAFLLLLYYYGHFCWKPIIEPFFFNFYSPRNAFILDPPLPLTFGHGLGGRGGGP